MTIPSRIMADFFLISVFLFAELQLIYYCCEEMREKLLVWGQYRTTLPFFCPPPKTPILG